MEPPPGCPPRVYDLMKCCWNWNSENRPTFTEARETLENMYQNSSSITDEVERQLTDNSNPRSGHPLHSHSHHSIDHSGGSTTTSNNSISSSNNHHKMGLSHQLLNPAPYKKFSGSSPNVHGLVTNAGHDGGAWNAVNINISGPNNNTSGGIISTKSTNVQLRRGNGLKSSSSSSDRQNNASNSAMMSNDNPPPSRSSRKKNHSNNHSKDGSAGSLDGMIMTPLTDIPSMQSMTKVSPSGSSGLGSNHSLNSKAAPIPPKRTSSFRDSTYNPDGFDPENEDVDEECEDGADCGLEARETMNGLEKVFESLSKESLSQEELEDQLNQIHRLQQQHLQKQQLQQRSDVGHGSLGHEPKASSASSGQGAKLSSAKSSKSKSKSNSNSSSNNSSESNEIKSRHRDREAEKVAALQIHNVKKAINRYGTMPKGARIGAYLESLEQVDFQRWR